MPPPTPAATVTFSSLTVGLSVFDVYVGPTRELVIFSPSPSLKYSLNVGELTVTFPLFSTVILYIMISPVSLIPFPFTSDTVAVFVASI